MQELFHLVKMLIDDPSQEWNMPLMLLNNSIGILYPIETNRFLNDVFFHFISPYGLICLLYPCRGTLRLSKKQDKRICSYRHALLISPAFSIPLYRV